MSTWSAERQALDLVGYSAPIPLAEPERANEARAALSGSHAYVKNPHVGSTAVIRLLSDPAVAHHLNILCGVRLRLWRSALFSKVNGSAEIGWHHDKHFFDACCDNIRLDEIGSHYSVLFALTDITHNTGMIQVIPGTHRVQPTLDRDSRPFHQRPVADHFISDIPPEVAATVRSVPMPRASFLVFHSALLHRSLAHTGEAPRMGLAIRLAREGITIPSALADPMHVMAFPPSLGL